MQVPLQITFRDMGSSAALETAIRKRASKLERYFDRIVSARVVVAADTPRNHKGRLFNVRLDLRVPGGDISVGGPSGPDHAHGDVYVAIRGAFEAAARQLDDRARRQRADVAAKAGDTPVHGRVSRLFRERGYGFVQLDGGREVYFHEASLAGALLAELDIGRAVRVVLAGIESEFGPEASSVVPLAAR